MNGRPIEILLVEDNAGDVRLTREALREGHVRNNLSVAKDGAEALAMLRREPQYGEAARPDLVLLDLNLPRLDRRQVLAEMKGDPNLRRIPVVVLTGNTVADIPGKALGVGCNDVLAKPCEPDALVRTVNRHIGRRRDDRSITATTDPGLIDAERRRSPR